MSAASRGARLRRSGSAAIAAGFVLLTGLVAMPQHAAAVDDSVTKSVTEERHYVNADGSTNVVEPNRTVSVTVDHTTNLRSLQLVHVSWTGAKPTAGLVGDQNSDLAQNEEYPMVLLECRGVDSTSVPASQQISPRTCWTQFADERMYYGFNDYPAWRSDANATAAERAAFVNQPAPSALPDACKNQLLGTANQHWLPFDGADGTTYAGGPEGCAGQAPEAASLNLSSLSLPSNETFGITDLQGNGQADFDIFTAEDHSSLGCSQKVSCSLVAIPIIGIDCDSTGHLLPAAQQPGSDSIDEAQTNCETTGRFTAGQSIPPATSGRDAVDGRLWWSASNWANRISVPLTFAPPDNACSLGNSDQPVNIYGSELLIQATTQWAPVFCLNKNLFNFNHVQTPEPQAATLLNTNNIDAAFVSQPPSGGFTRPVVAAPVAVTGFGIAFDVDDGKQQAVAHLNLNARLLAKLMTESYPARFEIQQSYAALSNNPINIRSDPEFQALNPGIPAKLMDQAATLLSLSSDSDVTYALTSYINADPEARAWLNGQPDPWGMVVNPNYKNIALPVNNWPLLDTYVQPYTRDENPCLNTSPVPFLPLVAAPTARLFTIGQDMQFAIAQSQTTCVTPNPDPSSFAGAKMVANGRQLGGARFMLGIVSLGDAAREGLHLAALQTHEDADAPVKFTDTTGRTFVTPDGASMAAATKFLAQDATTKMWNLQYPTMQSDADGAAAYPGTMVVYAAIPSSGLSKSLAKDYSGFLNLAASSLQTPGVGQGQLPDGYLPMTAANGLTALVDFTRQAALTVAAEGQATPPSTQPGSEPTFPTVPGQSSAPGSFGNGTLPSSTQSPTGRSTPATSSPAATAAVAYTSKLGTGAIGAILPILAGVVIVAGVAAAVIRLTGGGPAR